MCSDKIKSDIEGCKECSLHSERNNIVTGVGSEEADIMLIGEAPGENEDKKGKPFVGKAGGILTELLNGIDLEREDVFITNIVKCRPPDNRNPNKKEIESCSQYLKKEIDNVEPDIVVALGKFANIELIGEEIKVSEEHGKIKNVDYAGKNLKVFICYHPAASLYRNYTKNIMEDDFDKLKKIVEGEFKKQKKIDRFL